VPNSSITIMGKPCRAGHSGLRYRKRNACVECVKQQNRRTIKRRSPEVQAKVTARNNHTNRVRWRKIRDRENQKRKEYRATPRGKAQKLIYSITARTKKYDTKCTISLEWLEPRLVRGVCELTGIPFDFSRCEKGRGPYSPSVDRIDSSKGYEPSNCRVILWALNAAFSTWGAEAFQPIAAAWISRATNQQKE
jgi:hypothetical protein